MYSAVMLLFLHLYFPFNVYLEYLIVYFLGLKSIDNDSAWEMPFILESQESYTTANNINIKDAFFLNM